MAKLSRRLPGRGIGRVYGYVKCSVCGRLVADHTYEEARQHAAKIERRQPFGSSRRPRTTNPTGS